MAWISVLLNDEERLALRTLAKNEFRNLRAQAALLIRESLERRGYLLEPATNQYSPAPVKDAQSQEKQDDTK